MDGNELIHGCCFIRLYIMMHAGALQKQNLLGLKVLNCVIYDYNFVYISMNPNNYYNFYTDHFMFLYFFIMIHTYLLIFFDYFGFHLMNGFVKYLDFCYCFYFYYCYCYDVINLYSNYSIHLIKHIFYILCHIMSEYAKFQMFLMQILSYFCC